MLAFLSLNLVQAQEVLTGLTHNPVIMSQKLVKTREATPVNLPFFDDFSNYTGFPKPALWADQQAFVNNTYPVVPPSIGVATLDALNEKGLVYDHAETQPFGADTLTSNPIRLDYYQISDSLYFSFYYQPGGASWSYPPVEWERIGNSPETDDSLVVEFGYSINDSTFVWNHIWSTPGCTVDEWLNEDEHHLRYFKKVMIPVVDPQYLRSDFRFRFRNYASLEPKGYAARQSNVDQWHIDYVKLEQGGSYSDVYPHDIAFVSPTTSALKEYQSMPWNQYRASDMKDKFDNNMANISSGIINVSYSYRVTAENGALIGEQNSTSENANPYYNGGLYENPYHTEPPISFSYPPYNGADSAVFHITHLFSVTGGAGDDCIANDTCVFQQKFYNYYAYDDGTAESGFYLISELTNPETYLAVRFKLAQADTLRAVRIWFNSVLDDANVEPFTLMVWDDQINAEGKHVPGNVLSTLPNQYPDHASNPMDFVNYYLEEPLVVSGTFYVGTYQTHHVPLNIGFDQNNNASTHWVYNTSNEWREPFLYGAPMIRPVLGKHFDCTPVPEVNKWQFSVYPNPADQQITVVMDQLENQRCEAVLYDMLGRKVAEFLLNDNYNTLNISDLKSGMYLLQVKSDNQTAIKKIIKR